MNTWNRLWSARYMATDEDPGGEVPEEVIEDIEETPEDLEDDVTDPPAEEEAEADPLEELKAQLEAERAERDAKIAELEAKLSEKPKPEPADKPTVRGYRAEARQWVKDNRPDLLDEDGDLTPEGFDVAEDKALELVSEVKEYERRVSELKAREPELVKVAAADLTTKGLPEEDATEVASTYAALVTSWGDQMLQNTPEAAQLNETAMLIALGLKERARLNKAKEEDPEPIDARKKHAPVNNGGAPTNGNAYAKAMKDPDSASFLKDWEAKHERKPNAAELSSLIKKGLVKI